MLFCVLDFLNGSDKICIYIYAIRDICRVEQVCVDPGCHFKEYSVNLAFEFAMLSLSITMLQAFIFLTHLDRPLGSRPELLMLPDHGWGEFKADWFCGYLRIHEENGSRMKPGEHVP
jgi:hypothetical protein